MMISNDASYRKAVVADVGGARVGGGWKARTAAAWL
jgi:hypothetical protein